jgi:hypothetical protein
MALRSRFGSDRTGRGFGWLYDYDAASIYVLVQSEREIAVTAAVN